MKAILLAIFSLTSLAGTGHAAATIVNADGTAARDLYDATLNAGGKALHDLGEDGHAVLGGSACQRTFTRLTTYACNLRSAPGAAVLAISGDADSAAGQLFEALSAAGAVADDSDLGFRQRIRLTHLDCIAFAVNGGYRCVINQTFADEPQTGTYAVQLRALGSDKLGTEHYLATVSAGGAIVYQGIFCKGATPAVATCSTRTVAVEAVDHGPSSLFLALPSGQQVQVALACVAVKSGLSCVSAAR